MNQGSSEVKISNKICVCRFWIDYCMLKGIKFGLKMAWDLLMCDNLKYFGKGIGNEDRALIIH